jgi:hypothetical protein
LEGTPFRAPGLISVPGSDPPEPGDGAVAGEVVEVAEGHLAAAGVVDAQEQHGGSGVAALSVDAGEGGQPLAGEAFGQQWQIVGDGAAVDEL